MCSQVITSAPLLAGITVWLIGYGPLLGTIMKIEQLVRPFILIYVGLMSSVLDYNFFDVAVYAILKIKQSATPFTSISVDLFAFFSGLI
jgi:uncharacterized metal-binding protein